MVLGVTESDLGEDEDGSNRATVNRDVGAENPCKSAARGEGVRASSLGSYVFSCITMN